MRLPCPQTVQIDIFSPFSAPFNRQSRYYSDTFSTPTAPAGPYSLTHIDKHDKKYRCLIGCRVGDLIKMTKSCIINGAIEYIPRKMKEGRPLTERVPHNDMALEIVERYKRCEGDKLLPFISEQKYNVSIKRIFKAAGLKRLATVINPTTREEEKKVLYEIASSHLARRTFVGNLYKQVKDPNLVGALSGHKEGSRAFARYREIDEEMKKELVNLLS